MSKLSEYITRRGVKRRRRQALWKLLLQMKHLTHDSNEQRYRQDVKATVHSFRKYQIGWITIQFNQTANTVTNISLKDTYTVINVNNVRGIICSHRLSNAMHWIHPTRQTANLYSHSRKIDMCWGVVQRENIVWWTIARSSWTHGPIMR